MKCTCCTEEADRVVETEASGISFMCESCSDALFLTYLYPPPQQTELFSQ